MRSTKQQRLKRSEPIYRTDFPCCGQSRYAPVKRQAIDGKIWWCVWDNKFLQWTAVCKHRTRKETVLSILMGLRMGRLQFEPDDGRKDIEWLKRINLEAALSS